MQREPIPYLYAFPSNTLQQGQPHIWWRMGKHDERAATASSSIQHYTTPPIHSSWLLAAQAAISQKRCGMAEYSGAHSQAVRLCPCMLPSVDLYRQHLQQVCTQRSLGGCSPWILQVLVNHNHCLLCIVFTALSTQHTINGALWRGRQQVHTRAAASHAHVALAR